MMPERAAMREKHRVRPLTEQEDGCSWTKLPGGVFGFVYAPCNRGFPLFKNQGGCMFEIHKLSDETACLVGFVSEAAARRIESSQEQFDLNLLPEPEDDAQTLVAIPFDRIERYKEQSTREGSGVELRLLPAAR
jgi:hypothetical protein